MKPTIPTVIDRFRTYHAQNPTWGALHIVLEDGNTHDADVQFCIDLAVQIKDTEGEALARILLTMSQTQRRKIAKEA